MKTLLTFKMGDFRSSGTYNIFNIFYYYMKIAIPSHNRYEIIQTHTLPLLQKYNFDFDCVFVFGG
jgi:hypothetical protein